MESIIKLLLLLFVFINLLFINLKRKLYVIPRISSFFSQTSQRIKFFNYYTQ